MVHRLEEYNNYILFQNKIADERIKGIEQGMLRISERIHELYGVGFPNSFILMLARWVYFGNVFDDALPEDSAEMQQLVADLTEAVRRDAPYSFAVASDLLLMVQNTTDVHFSSIGILMISAFVEVLHRPGNKLPVQAYPIATANNKEDISAPIMSRFAVIDIPDYTFEEKKIIFTKFAMPKVLKRIGLREEECVVTDAGLDAVIHQFENTTGIRDIEQAAEHLAANALYQIEVEHAGHVV